MNNWETCPKCKGSKTTQRTINCPHIQCDICDGKGIISSITGLPPKSGLATTTDELNKKLADALKSIEIKPVEIAPLTNCPVDYVPPKLSGGYTPDASIKYTLEVTNVIGDLMKSMTDNGFVKTKSNI